MANILITGSNRGIGAALAAEAEGRGHAILRATRAGHGGDVIFDISEPLQVENAMSVINQPIDIVINNAGIIGPDSPTTDMDWTAMAHTFAVNVGGALAVSTACLDHLRRSSRPRILTISSQMSYMGYAKSDRISYRASKAAVNKVMQGVVSVHIDHMKQRRAPRRSCSCSE
jgi:NAD(P)-dependent dehydrogenase (short-subunit alcohol dehydrogenase family)